MLFRSTLVQLHGDLAGAVDLHEVRQLVAPDIARARSEHDVVLIPARLVLRQRQDRGDRLVLLQRQQVDERLADRLRRLQSRD